MTLLENVKDAEMPEVEYSVKRIYVQRVKTVMDSANRTIDYHDVHHIKSTLGASVVITFHVSRSCSSCCRVRVY
jgi:hypothetical protein